MQSILLISNDPAQTKAYLENFSRGKNINQFDIHPFEPAENSFGIEDVRQVQKAAYLSPARSKEKMLIVQQADTLTPEAQNALLKLLEEPPQNTYIFLVALSDVPFLPTVLSRCKKIILAQTKGEISTEEKENLEKNITALKEGSVGEKLALAESLAKEKDRAGEWLRNMIMLLREKMLIQPTETIYPVLLQRLQEAYMLLKSTNVSPRSLLERTFLNFF